MKKQKGGIKETIGQGRSNERKEDRKKQGRREGREETGRAEDRKEIAFCAVGGEGVMLVWKPWQRKRSWNSVLYS